jgi:hypothetical protein
MIRALSKYPGCVVSLHGRSFGVRPVLNYYKSATMRVHCLRSQDKDVRVNVGGTGVMAWHHSSLRLRIADFPTPNMADVYMAKACHEQIVPIVALAHEEDYLKYQHPERTIYLDAANDCSLQTRIVNTFLK